MDYIQFYSENREFKIEFTKRLKPISWSKYAKYICNINFKDNLDNIILSIQCSEKEFYDALQSLNEFQMNLGAIISDNIYFQSTMNSFFIYVSSLNNAYLDKLSTDIYDHPMDDDSLEDKLQMSIYQNSIKGNILRLYFEMTYMYLEDFIMNMFTLMEDIPYLSEMSNSSFLEYMDYQFSQIPQ